MFTKNKRRREVRMGSGELDINLQMPKRKSQRLVELQATSGATMEIKERRIIKHISRKGRNAAIIAEAGEIFEGTRLERDKALQGLNRLKQHLLEKEAGKSEKMDEDSKVTEELRKINEYQRVQILHLEKALRQAIGSQEEIKMSNNNGLKKSKETIDELNRKLASCMSTIEAKNIEVLNLQTALGQYYAEIEAKECLREELVVVKEKSARLFEQLKDAHHQAGALKEEKGK